MTGHRRNSFAWLVDALQKRAHHTTVVSETDHCLCRPSIDGDLKDESRDAGVDKYDVADLMREDERPLVLAAGQVRRNDDLALEHVYVGEARRVPDLDRGAKRKRCCKANRGEHHSIYHGGR